MKRGMLLGVALLLWGAAAQATIRLTPLSPGAVCTTQTHRGSLAWKYDYVDEIYHVYIQPGQGNNVLDCLPESFICETIACDVASSSDFACKDEDLPVSHCVDYVVAQCEGEQGLEMPFVWELELVSTGPCP